MDTCEVSTVILTYNTKELIRWCLDKNLPLLRNVDSEVIVVDNGSCDDSSSDIQERYPEVKLLRTEKNLGFGGGNNLGIQAARGRYVILLNSDAYFHPGALEKAINWLRHAPRTGALGVKLIMENGGWQPYARKFPTLVDYGLMLSGLGQCFPDSKLFNRSDYKWYKDLSPIQVDWITGACMIFPKQVLNQVGGFDERFYLYFEEVDLCKRIQQAGYEIWCIPDAVVTHLVGQTCRSSKREEYNFMSGLLYFRKHHGYFGAQGYKCLFRFYHWMRYWKNTLIPSSTSLRKQAESSEFISIANRAWKRTSGGKVSPMIPW